MQEQKASKATSIIARIGLKNIVGISIFTALMLAVAVTWLAPYNSLPTATWRVANDTLPWRNDSLRVENVTGHWESAAGNARMMLRTAYYPVADIELGESEGSGMLYVRFTDEKGHQAGDTINLYYNKGSFHPRQEVNITAEGTRARVFVEAGYDKESDFKLHQLDESIPLWRIEILYRPDGDADMKPMGSVTISAELEQ